MYSRGTQRIKTAGPSAGPSPKSEAPVLSFIYSRGTRPKSQALMLCAVALTGLTGCAGFSSSLPVQSGGLSHEAATITVHNRRFADVRVYVVLNQATYRLGSVESFRTRTFNIPRVIPLPSEIGLLVSAFASDEQYTSPLISVSRGEGIVFTLENTPQFSSIVRRFRSP